MSTSSQKDASVQPAQDEKKFEVGWRKSIVAVLANTFFVFAVFYIFPPEIGTKGKLPMTLFLVCVVAVLPVIFLGTIYGLALCVKQFVTKDDGTNDDDASLLTPFS